MVASPTFSLPEYIGGTRNWDYRASWIRDSSFTLYALIRLGFTHEANGAYMLIFLLDSKRQVYEWLKLDIYTHLAYMDFIFERVKQKNKDGSLKIMYVLVLPTLCLRHDSSISRY